MSDGAKDQVRTFVRHAVERLRERGQGVAAYRGVALYDTRKDETFTSLDSFPAASDALAELPHFEERYGDAERTRQALQFVYRVLAGLTEPEFSEQVFEHVWTDFAEELTEPTWTYLGVTNLTSITVESDPLTLGDGLVIRGRSLDDLRAMGFPDAVIQRLSGDWMEDFGAASSYVLLVEDHVEKSPDTVVLTTSPVLATKAHRLLGALRLAAPGAAGFGRLYVHRVARFEAGLGGWSATGMPRSAIFASPEYHLSDMVASDAIKLYEDLHHLEQRGYGVGPGNLDLALQSFMISYDRSPFTFQAVLVDLVTALEALLGTDAELKFRLAFRVAGLLAATDAERVSVFQDIKRYYAIRSKIVHGSPLKPAEHERLLDVESFRAYVRRLLRAGVHLAASEGHGYGKEFWESRLDDTLLDAGARAKLQRTMALAPDD